MKSKYLLLGLIASAIMFSAGSAYAVCPVCVVAVGAGVGLCRWLGVDDMISGLWIGALLLAIIIWCLNWMKKKNISFKFSWLVVAAIFYLVAILPLYQFNIMGHPLNKFWGIDKLLLGIILGSVIFLISVLFNNFLKNKNEGKVYFPYQKVVIPLLLLLILSLIFHFVIGCQIKIPFT